MERVGGFKSFRNERSQRSGPAASGAHTLLAFESERGDVIVFTAIVALLLVMFIFVYGVQLSYIHATFIRSQNALDTGTVAAVVTLPGQYETANLAASTTEAVLENRLLQSAGTFSNNVSGADKYYRLVIPRLGYGATQADVWKQFPLSTNMASVIGASIGTTADDIEIGKLLYGDSGDGVGALFDPRLTSGASLRIDDFGNAIYQFGRFDPFPIFTMGAFTPRVQAASAVLLQPKMFYVLVDTAFSTSTEVNQFAFGQYQYSDGGSYEVAHSHQWPLSGVPYGTTGDWYFPTDMGLLGTHPHNGGLFPCPSCTGPSDPQYVALQTDIQEFYAELCRSAPFYNNINAAVSLLDVLERSSAYASTTSVGIAGPTSLIPIHPAAVSGGYSQHPAASASFPLPAVFGDSSDNSFLHSLKTTAFRGWVNTTATTEASATTASGVNLPELCLCRALLTSGDAAAPLSSDVAKANGDPTDFDNTSAAARSRAAGPVHWCTDDTTDQQAVELSSARSGAGGGDVARNILAMQGMRLKNNNYYKLFGPTAWSRPSLDATTGSGLQTAVRNLSPSIRAAADYLRDAQAAYSDPSPAALGEDNPYTVFRPIGPKDMQLIVVAFGGASEAYVQQVKASHGFPDDATAYAFAKDEFISALAYVVCGRDDAANVAKVPVPMILALTPYSDYDRQFVLDILPTLQDFTNYLYARQNGEASPGTIPACEGTAIATLFFYHNDYQSFDPPGTDADSRRAQMLAASTYFMNTFTSQMVLPLIRNYAVAF